MRWFAVVLVVLALGAWPAAAGASGWSLEHAANATFRAVPHLIAAGGGAVVNVTSRGAFRGEPDTPAYGASKAGLNAFAQSMSLEHAANATFPDGIVSGVSCANDAACVAVGSYVNADDYYATLAERWDGSTWSIVPTPNATGAPDSWFNHVACSTASDCVAVGASGNRSDGIDNEHALIEHWDGASWTMEPAPSGTGELLGVACSSPSACTAVGNNVALRWDGTSWSTQALAIPADKDDLPLRLTGVSCPAGAACTAIGYYEAGTAGLKPIAERWDGTGWTTQPTPAPSGSRGVFMYGISCATTASCTAVGQNFPASGNGVPLALGWDGTSWSVEATPVPPGANDATVLLDVSCTAADTCTAVGDLGQVLRWDGGSWSAQAPVPPRGVPPTFDGVSCTSATACTAVGDPGETVPPLAEHWDGTAWATQDMPSPSGGGDSGLAGVSCAAATACSAVGNFGFGPTPSPLSERWNGTGWATDPIADAGGATMSGVSCSASSACAAVGYVDGDYRTHDPTARTAVAQLWNGTAWSVTVLPPPPSGEGTALFGVSCRSAKFCMAVGEQSVSTVGTTTALVERWNGASWSALPTPDPTGATDSSLFGVSCTSPGACTAVGDMTIGGVEVPLAERWDGARWIIQGAIAPAGSNSALTSVSCATGSACTAVGWVIQGCCSQAVAEHWNGGTWLLDSTPAPAGNQGAALTGASCAAANACTAVGYYLDSAFGIHTHAMRWNGASWAIQPTPDPAASRAADFTGVSCPTRTSCTAVGNAINGAGRPVTLAEGYSG